MRGWLKRSRKPSSSCRAGSSFRSKLADFRCIKAQSVRRVDGTLQIWVLTRQRIMSRVACKKLLNKFSICAPPADCQAFDSSCASGNVARLLCGSWDRPISCSLLSSTSTGWMRRKTLFKQLQKIRSCFTRHSARTAVDSSATKSMPASSNDRR